jgi:hypothetical protein
MPRTIAPAFTRGSLALIAALGVARLAQAQVAKGPYPSMAPIERYLMDRDAEIALARSAAPVAVSRDAEVLVLGRKGFDTAVKGTNGFVCAVERSWASPFNHPQFWNPKIRSAVCFNPEAARTVLPAMVKRTELVLAGLPTAQVIAEVAAAFDRKEMLPPAPGSMAYMMSKDAYPNDAGNLSHVMFFVPLTDAKTWGAGLTGSFIIAFDTPEEQQTTFIVPVGQWSDGTSILANHSH